MRQQATIYLPVQFWWDYKKSNKSGGTWKLFAGNGWNDPKPKVEVPEAWCQQVIFRLVPPNDRCFFVYLSTVTHPSLAKDNHTTLIMRPASDNSPGLAGRVPHCMQYTMVSFKAACARNLSATLLRTIKCVFACMCLCKCISLSVVAIHFIFWWHFPAGDTGHWYNSSYADIRTKCQLYGSLHESNMFLSPLNDR